MNNLFDFSNMLLYNINKDYKKEKKMITYEPLWKTLDEKKISKTQLRNLVGFSTVTLSKLTKNEPISLRIIDDICEALGLHSISEVVEFISPVINIDYIKKLVYKLKNNTKDGVIDKIFITDQLKIYIIIEQILNEKNDRLSIEEVDEITRLYSICVKYELLPQDLLDGINKMLSKHILK